MIIQILFLRNCKWTVLSAFISIFSLQSSYAISASDTCTWTADAGNWENADNWSCDGVQRVPLPGDVIFIGKAPTANQHVTINSDVLIAGLTLDANRRLIIKGSLVINGDMSWSCCAIDNGNLSSQPNGIVQVDGNLNMTGISNSELNRIDFEVSGSVIMNKEENGRFNIGTNASFTNQSSFTIENGTHIGGSGIFINNGTLLKSGGSERIAIDPTMNSTGIINASMGTLALQRGGSIEGTLATSDQTTIEFGPIGGGLQGSSTLTVLTAELTGDGKFMLAFGNLELNSSINVPPGATFTVHNGVLKVFESMTVHGSLEWRSGTITGTKPVTITSDGQFTVFSASARKLDGVHLSLNGQSTVPEGNNANIEFLNDAVFTINEGADFLIVGSIVIWGNGEYINHGTLFIDHVSTGIATKSLLNTGEIRLDVAGLIVGDFFQSNEDTDFENTGLITGNGAVSLDPVKPFINSGTFAPEQKNDIETKPGQLSVSNGYINGILKIDIEDHSGPGIGHDHLSVSGQAQLQGRLDVNAVNLEEPGEFIIVTCSGISPCIQGTFATTQIEGPYGMMVEYNDNNVKLIVGGPPLLEVIVNSTGDDVDNNPGDGLCDTGETINRNGIPEPECTLRAVIMEANTESGLDRILFDIPGDQPPVITPGSALPAILVSVIIEGTSQPGEGRIRVDGFEAGVDANGLHIQNTQDVEIRGMALYNFDGSGIKISGGSNHLIENNYLGFDGTSLQYNKRDGITVTDGATDVTVGSL
ncbi:MAG: hypothetical protein ACFCU6_01900, partial [Balneolaceae bacterium]